MMVRHLGVSIVEAEEAVVIHVRLVESVEMIKARSNIDKKAFLYKIWLRCDMAENTSPAVEVSESH